VGRNGNYYQRVLRKTDCQGAIEVIKEKYCGESGQENSRNGKRFRKAQSSSTERNKNKLAPFIYTGGLGGLREQRKGLLTAGGAGQGNRGSIAF